MKITILNAITKGLLAVLGLAWRALKAGWHAWSKLIRTHWKKIWHYGWRAGGIAFGLLAAYFAFLYFTLPDVRDINVRVQNRTIKYLDRTGKVTLYESFVEEKRSKVPLEKVSQLVQDATIAVEDKTFYEHQGFNFKRLAKSIVVDVLTLSKAQGGSTLTQQLVKNAILTRDKTLTRKLKELLLAYRLEKNYSKRDILEMYLNEIPYGGNVYGVEAAAQTFFKKSASDVSLAEAAILASVPQAPSFYSPYGNHKDRLFARQRLVLSLMEEQGKITPEQRKAAEEEKVAFIPRREKIIAPHFIFEVRDKLEELFGSVKVEQGGLEVVTTLDADLQKAAEDAVTARAEANAKLNASNAAAVAIDTASGDVRALVGSRDYYDESIDGNVNVATRPRQPGSSIKPFVYAAGFARGLTPDTTVFDLETDFINTDGKKYTPYDYDLKTRGPVTLRQSLAGSLNIPAVKVLYMVTVPEALKTLLGFHYSTIGAESRYGLSLVLGGLEVKLIEHVNAYAALAREGKWQEYHTILSVTDDKGEKIWEKPETAESEEALPANAVRQLQSVMSDNDARAYVFGAKNYLTLPDRPVAAKTGTTNGFVDAWTMGFVPQMAVGVWVGNSDGSQMKKGADGSVVAAPIWNAIMRAATAALPAVPFNAPDDTGAAKAALSGHNFGLTDANVDAVTGQVIPDECLASYPPRYVKKSKIPNVVTILSVVKPGDISGPLPENPTADPNYEAWNAPIREWAAKNGMTGGTPAVPSCDWRQAVQEGELFIGAPSENQLVSSQELFVQTQLFNSSLEKLSITMDGDSVYEGADPSPTLQLPLGLPDGLHELRFKAVTAQKTLLEKSVTIQTRNFAPARASFSWRGNGAHYDDERKALVLSYSLADDKGIAGIDCYAKAPDGQSLFLNAAKPAVGDSDLAAGRALPAGAYGAYCRVNFNDGSYQLTPTANFTLE